MEELLLEAERAEEKRRVELDRLRADQFLSAIASLEQRISEINELADSEIRLIEEYRNTELTKIQKKTSWFSWNLEQYIRSSGEKTINLPHGCIKLRLGRDKVNIVDLQQFLKDSTNQKFLKIVPESYQPDILAIQEYIKTTGHVPDGIELKTAESKFFYLTKRSNENGKEQREREDKVRAATESTDEGKTT